MIRKFMLPLLAIVLLSSCANKFSLVKRKYNKGFYVGVSHKHDAKKLNEVTSTSKIAKQTSVEEGVKTEEAISVTPLAQDVNQPVQESPLVKNAQSSSHQQQTAGPVVASAEKNAPAVALKKQFKALTAEKGKKAADSDLNLVIMIILCLFPFINLIPVYLHDGGVSLNFWITLILDLLFFIPGIIFALLVVLDVVDLK